MPTAPRCKVCALQHALERSAWDALVTALAGVPNVTVATILTRHGHPISEATIRRHKGHQ